MQNAKTIRSKGDIWVDLFVHFMIALFTIFFLYPIIYVLVNSLSAQDAVMRREVWLWPVGFSKRSYEMIFNHAYVLPSYWNTIKYTAVATAYSMVLTILGAYPLSRKGLPGRDGIMMFIAFTMLFSGGLVPTYLLVRDLGLLNNFWAMVLPCAVTPFNLVMMRTFMQTIPDSIEESAKIDGANDWIILIRIILPMSLASIATIGLFYLIGNWNSWFNALIYLTDKALYPLQLILREMLINSDDKTLNREMMKSMKDAVTPLGFKCALMVVSMLPLLVIYPFVQRYFVQGVMIGAVKG